MNTPRLILAAPASGSGKTTLTAGLIAVLTARGLQVAPFKVGPDYIDPGYHALSRVRLAGILLNRVGGPAHAQMVKEAIESETALPVLGYLQSDEALHLPERHLGLIPTAEPGRWREWANGVCQKVESTVNIERILELAGTAPPLIDLTDDPFAAVPAASHPIIAVARDAAFNFIYEDNLDLLRAAGAEIAFFSPLADSTLPQNAQAIYLCGGFPEVYAAELSANVSMRESIRAAHAANLPIYAECGGLMYLTEAICDLHGPVYPMVGLLSGLSAMTPRLTLGYRTFCALGNNWLWQSGETMRGHEFHHSIWQSRPDGLPFLYELQPDALTRESRLEGAFLGNLIASYTHLHFLSHPQLAARFVLAAGDHNGWRPIT